MKLFIVLVVLVTLCLDIVDWVHGVPVTYLRLLTVDAALLMYVVLYEYREVHDTRA